MSEHKEENKFEYIFSVSNRNIIITEMADLNEKNATKSEHKEPFDGYYVEEPFDQFDYIFEPDHYPKSNKLPKPETTQEAACANENKLTFARIIRENEGQLEYEYQRFKFIDKYLDSGSKTSKDVIDLFFNLSHDNHLDAIVRNINITKWPNVGFGFNLAKHCHDDERFIYVSSIKSNSPAEFSLQLGDILVEIDEMNPCESFKSLNDLEKYLNEKQSLHLLAIHESKYFKLKSENEDFIQICEDIVIV